MPDAPPPTIITLLIFIVPLEESRRITARGGFSLSFAHI